MSKVAVIYWSGTGNTEAMANAIIDGAKGAGAEVSVFTSAEATRDSVSGCNAVALGCPSMGAEVLEESEFQPMWDEIKGALAGKKILLFGSYGWGDGEWMRNWEEEASGSGLNVVDSPICQEMPDGDMVSKLAALGASLA